jgi:hypothetical protein
MGGIATILTSDAGESPPAVKKHKHNEDRRRAHGEIK